MLENSDIPLSAAELAEMKARLAAATTGLGEDGKYRGVFYFKERLKDAAPESMAALIAEVERLQGIVGLAKDLAAYTGSNTHSFPFDPDDMSCAPLRLWMPLWDVLREASDAG